MGLDRFIQLSLFTGYSDHSCNDILDLPVGFRVPTEFVCVIERITFITISLYNSVGLPYKSLYVKPKTPLRDAEFNIFFVFTNFVSMHKLFREP